MSAQGEVHHSNLLPGSLQRLEDLLSQPRNRSCADCGSLDPKWVCDQREDHLYFKALDAYRDMKSDMWVKTPFTMTSFGDIRGLANCKTAPKRRCSEAEVGEYRGIHMHKVFRRSQGIRVTYLKVKLDDWTDEQVEAVARMGGNSVVNMKYEACLPDNLKPKPEAPAKERSAYIRRKYELQEFVAKEEVISPAFCSLRTSQSMSSGRHPDCSQDRKVEKHHSNRFHGIGLNFRNSWRKKEQEQKATNKNSTMGMVEFVGLIKVNVIRGTNLAVRDVVTSDPYVMLTMGNQTLKTRVIKSNLNPVWNEKVVLSIPNTVPPLKLQVYDKDTFSADDRMGEAEVDIQPLVAASVAYENSDIREPMQLGKWRASEDNSLVKDSLITLVDGKVKQEITLKLKNVERGELEIELECVPLTQ